ncbi:MAG: hypothetical protein IOC64_00865 [Methylobacterium sp.]|nr:hypothetical protein [Methylobacterium sp.]MCA3618320.1 hypothetical protein [Methylobacterium sp.]
MNDIFGLEEEFAAMPIGPATEFPSASTISILAATRLAWCPLAPGSRSIRPSAAGAKSDLNE